jgi:hypothetical protein
LAIEGITFFFRSSLYVLSQPGWQNRHVHCTLPFYSLVVQFTIKQTRREKVKNPMASLSILLILLASYSPANASGLQAAYPVSVVKDGDLIQFNKEILFNLNVNAHPTDAINLYNVFDSSVPHRSLHIADRCSIRVPSPANTQMKISLKSIFKVAWQGDSLELLEPTTGEHQGYVHCDVVLGGGSSLSVQPIGKNILNNEHLAMVSASLVEADQ